MYKIRLNLSVFSYIMINIVYDNADKMRGWDFLKNRVIGMLVCVSLLAGLLPTMASAEDFTSVKDYLQLGDYVTILPAENQNGVVESTVWALNAQDGGNINGQDVHFWDMGTSSKFCVRRSRSDGAFALIASTLEETQDANDNSGIYFWDLEGKKTGSGTNIHVWEDDDLNDDNKLFYLEEDGDGDPETFYICSYYARGKNTKYLVPRSYHSDGKTWEDNGRNVVLSSDKFHWRVQVINREAYENSANWMDQFDDSTLLSSLNMPGAHDAGTANVAGDGTAGIATCQKYFIDELLIAGVRVMDIRYADHNEEIVLVHGNGDTLCRNKDHGGLPNGADANSNLTLQQTVKTAIDFLKDNPSETVIMTLKQDDNNSKAPQGMVNTLLDSSFKNGEKEEFYRDYYYDWSSSSPTLGDVRGKIVFMTRTLMDSLETKRNGVDYRKQFGPNLFNWDDLYDDDKHYAQRINNAESGFCGVWVQDDYECSDSNKEMQVKNVLQQLAGELTEWDGKPVPSIPVTDFVFNYTSKTTSDSNVTPLDAARGMNAYVLESNQVSKYFSGGYRTGIVMMDYVDKSMAQRVINSNYSKTQTFTDVSETDWFHDAVYEAVQKGYFAGVSKTKFEPNTPMTRAMMVQVLYNAQGKPSVEGQQNVFIDVLEDTWYADAVIWASGEKLVAGYGDNMFGPLDSVTREQAAQIMYQYAAYKEYDTSATADLDVFTDSGSISDWAVSAMQWAVGSGLMVGVEDNQLAPKNLATRAQMAQIFVNFYRAHNA